MPENENRNGPEEHARQVLALLKVVGEIAGVSDEFIAAYARAHLRYEAAPIPPEAEERLDAAEVDLLGVTSSAEERLALAANLLDGLTLPDRIAGTKRRRLNWSLEAARLELSELVRELQAIGGER